MTDYDRQMLQDIADVPLPTHPVAHRGGVAFHTGRMEGVAEGTMMTADRARRLGAQLLLAADEHDAIADQAVDDYRDQIAKASPIRRVQR